MAKRQARPKTDENGIEGKVNYPEAGDYPQISDGSKANVLIYAVYDNEGKIVESLGNGYVDKDFKQLTDITKLKWIKGGDNVQAPQGQTIVYLGEGNDYFPFTISVRLVRNQTYTFAFWAQSSECEAFDTQDLKAVKIKYQHEDKVDGTAGDNTLCNYELRDAFCKSETFTVVQSGSRYVVLNRPFAQINVGITKADYEAAVKGNMRITQSRIHIENVATELNVVSNAINTDPDKIQAIDYEFNTIPAYVNYSTAPTEEDLKAFYDQNGGAAAVAAASYGQEQFLKVDLNRDGKIAEYGKKNDNENNPRDETYKYLMMCYVLPADRTDNASTYSTTLDKVVVTLKDDKNGREFVLADGLENLPIQRNWRTNIVGDLLTSEINLIIDVDPIYSGDYNAPDYAVIAEGVSYELVRDGNDEVIERIIYLSNAKGLQWFSDASNGKWKDDKEYEKAHPEGNVDLFREVVGLKEDEWPKDNYGTGIFNFEGCTIKLTNDVDWALAYSLGIVPSEYWTPISSTWSGYDEAKQFDAYAFCGVFDGGNHTISNLKVDFAGDDKYNYAGLFGMVTAPSISNGYSAIQNIRLFNIEIKGHYCVGGIVGRIVSNVKYGETYAWNPVYITNCYVDQGMILNTPRNRGDDTFDRGNNAGGILGQSYGACVIENCYVRHLTIRAFRTVGGLWGNSGGDFARMEAKGCTVSDVTLIYDQFQPYDDKGTRGWIKANIDQVGEYCGETFNPAIVTNCNAYNVNIIKFVLCNDGDVTPPDLRKAAIGNVSIDILPKLSGEYVDELHLFSSLLGNPSTVKSANDDTPVGVYVKGITLDGTPGTFDGSTFKLDATNLDYYTITVNNTGDKVCAVYLVADDLMTGVYDRSDYRQTGLKNIAIHGNLKVNEGVCLAPMAGQTIMFENVSVYDAQTVLTDNGTGAGTLKVTTSNFRGNIALSPNYSSITFDGTVFEPATDNIADHTFTSESNVTFNGCTFKAPYTFVGSANFVNCKVIGTTEDKYEELNGEKSGFNYSLDYVTGKPKAE